MPNIDFHAIRSHDASQHRGFEELCCQLIPVVEGLPQGTDLVRHGTPDGGVECLITWPDGNVWGWQAKYLFRLRNTEFSQLDRSVKSALDNYPELTRYTFCLPYNRPAGQVPGQKSAMQKWKEHCEKWKRWAAERGMTVEFNYIGESQLLSALTLPGQEGRARYWFDATILTPKWFKETVDLAIENAGPRYTSEPNVELPIASVFEGLGRTQEFQTRLRVALREVRDKRRWWSASRDAPAEDAELTGMLDRCRALLDELDRQIMAVNVVGASLVGFDDLAARCQEAIDALDQAAEYCSNKAGEAHRGLPAEAHESEKDRQMRQTWESAAWELRRTAFALWALKDLLLSDAARLVNVPALLITGGPGTGKTHGAAVILGSVVTTAELEPTEPLPPEEKYCDECQLCMASCLSGLMHKKERTTVTIGGMEFSYSKRRTYHRCDLVCGGFTGLAKNGKWSTWSPGRFAIPQKEEEFLPALRKAVMRSWGRPEIEGGFHHPAMPGHRKLNFTCGNCQLICHPDREERKRRYKLLTKNGVVVQHPDGALEAVSPEIAEKHLAEMSPEQRACYEEVRAVAGAVR